MSIRSRLPQFALCAVLLTSAGPETLYADNTRDVSSQKNHVVDPLFVDHQMGDNAVALDTIDTDDPEPFTSSDGIYFFHQAMGLAWQKVVQHVSQSSDGGWIENLDPIILQSSVRLGPFDGMYVPSQGESGKNVSHLIINANNYKLYTPEKYDSREAAIDELSDVLSLELYVKLEEIIDLQNQERQAFSYLIEDYSFREVEKTPQSEEAVSFTVRSSSLRLINFLHQLRSKKESQNAPSPE